MDRDEGERPLYDRITNVYSLEGRLLVRDAHANSLDNQRVGSHPTRIYSAGLGEIKRRKIPDGDVPSNGLLCFWSVARGTLRVRQA